ncbi:MAG: TlpA family protein disulfide reductase [Lachnospiraceae bacterium]|nr:TlpA family protein disulfide reductase [Lachnospiraceae bacterium]
MKKILTCTIFIISVLFVFSCAKKQTEALNNKQSQDAAGTVRQDDSATKQYKDDDVYFDMVVGMTMPNVKIETNKGVDFDLSKTNKPVLMNFWATWCPPCRMEMPGLQSLYEEYGDKVDFVMINLGETKETIQDFLVENEYYTFPIGYDTNNYYGNKFVMTSIPTTFIIGKDKILRNYIIGARPEEQFREYIEEAIK